MRARLASSLLPVLQCLLCGHPGGVRGTLLPNLGASLVILGQASHTALPNHVKSGCWQLMAVSLPGHSSSSFAPVLEQLIPAGAAPLLATEVTVVPSQERSFGKWKRKNRAPSPGEPWFPLPRGHLKHNSDILRVPLQHQGAKA